MFSRDSLSLSLSFGLTRLLSNGLESAVFVIREARCPFFGAELLFVDVTPNVAIQEASQLKINKT